MATPVDPKPPKKAARARSNPGDRAVRLLTRLPLGDLTRAADALVENDRETAEYLSEKLQKALGKS